ncbi:uncharacterized protein C2845_PM01G14540 [Panicum miliaceum]|uniref:MIP18 family-like domain-containing protein n=1 Tax=Panicum miliaceum TaxID=4540 RepID=A0A3L6TI42_PANMI|nr:uncharacterized protein C2845_PM01G14540 [Panicum miliaceum]
MKARLLSRGGGAPPFSISGKGSSPLLSSPPPSGPDLSCPGGRSNPAMRLLEVEGKFPLDFIDRSDLAHPRCRRAGFARRIRAGGGSEGVDIKDPEHPYSLEQLNVVTEDSVELNDERNYVRVTFTPTVEHCSMATVIGLCIRVKLIRSLPPRYKVDIRVAPGSHSTEAAVNKQLNDKECVAAALENPNLLDMVEECLSPTFD